MRKDVFRLRRERDPGRLSIGIEKSRNLRMRRAEQLAKLELDLESQLPIAEHQAELTRLIREHQVVVVAGETGSGKTTQLPKIALDLGLGVSGMIAHTQPRRLAARTVAKRIAAETGSILGEEIGYAVRFSDQVKDETLVKVMTDGLLLTEIRRDRYLEAYDMVIIDEAHERSLNIDFLLGYLKRLLTKRRDLKVVITSATIDLERFAGFFNDAPIVRVSGRTYPVEVRYSEPTEEAIEGITAALQEITRAPLTAARDTLVFFSGEREIFEAAKQLRKVFVDQFEVLPLYARLSFAEQQKIFEPSGGRRRVVLATNVAETSLTVPNIGYVIDPGFARVNRYSYRSKLQRLPVEPISQASANQRKGRCGRIAPGLCFRLYAEEDFQSRPEFTDPEIHRVNLASVVLQMQAFRLGDISTFPFIDPPDPRAVKDAMRLLEELQAISRGKLTKAGQVMARMPIDPRLARMLVEANRLGATQEVMIIVAALAVQDPRERPLQKAQAADQAHEMFQDLKSDFVSIVKLWDWIETQRQALTQSRFRTLLKKRFINYQRWREWREVHRQLRSVAREVGIRENSAPAKYQSIHESILSGSLSLIGQHDERGLYLGARNLKMRIFPGSGLAGVTPKWIVAAEIAETSRVYARSVAAVEPRWIEQQATHLLKSNYSAPFWSLERGEAMAHKTVSLYGLRLADKRRVGYGKVDPQHSRDLFIREGLIQGRVKNPPDFLQRNLLTMARVEEMEAKGRRKDLLVSEDEIYAFYDNRIERRVARMGDLKAWLKTADAQTQNSLVLSEEDLIRVSDASLNHDNYPSHIELQGVALDIKYRFAPGEKDDGVTLIVPVGMLPVIGVEPLEWSVPGFLPRLVEQWLRTLPKNKRRTLVPLPDRVEELMPYLLRSEVYRHGRLLAALKRLLRDRYRLDIVEKDWDRNRVEPHLLVNVRVVDQDHKVLAQGRDVRKLRQQLLNTELTAGAKEHQRTKEQQNLKALPAQGLSHHELLGRKDAPVIKYPGLVDQGEQVDLVLFDDEASRDVAHRQGLSRLALQALGKTSGYFRRELDKHPQLGLHFATLGSAAQLKDELLRNTVWMCFFEGQTLPQNQTQLDEMIRAGKGKFSDVFDSIVGQFSESMALRFACSRALDGLNSQAYQASRLDIEQHLKSLVPINLLEETPRAYLRLVPRYLLGVQRRIENLPGHVPKDIKLINELSPLLHRLDQLNKAELADSERNLALRFYLEELRLNSFAEPIARQKVAQHPLDEAFFGPNWKASFKRVEAQIFAEEQRVGLT